MTWLVGRQLSKLTTSDDTVTYKYNADGLRTYMDDSDFTRKYYYDNNNNMIGMTKGSSPIFFQYDSEGNVVSMTFGGTRYYYIKNQQGDVEKIVDKVGNVVVTYKYDAWGNPCGMTDTSGVWGIGSMNPFRYRSYVYDDNTGLYYLRSRYYDPVTGRFLNADDVSHIGATGTPLSSNVFAYCENDFINRIDCTGTSSRGFLSLKSDAQGREILQHYLYGRGEDFIKVDGDWGKYMKKNTTLKEKVKEIVLPIGKKLKKGHKKRIDLTKSMEIENGEDIIGYQYLHGTNSDAGGFRIIGTIKKKKNGKIVYDLTYIWNDIIDPNYYYPTDQKKSKIAKWIPFADPMDYYICIAWTDKTVITSNKKIIKGG